MKYLQHESNARNDIKIKHLRRKFGIVGYGVYFIMLEVIAENVKPDNHDQWGYVDEYYDVATLADEAGVDPEELREILQYCNKLKLFEKKDEKLYCKSILKRLDEYSQVIQRNAQRRSKIGKKPTTSESLPSQSGEKRVEENRIEKNKIKENKKEESVSAEKPAEPPAKNVKKRERKEPEEQNQLERIVYLLEDETKANIVTWGKQGKALNMMLESGYTEDQIKFTIKKMAKDTYYDDKGFDLMTVADQIAKVKASMEKVIKHDVL